MSSFLSKLLALLVESHQPLSANDAQSAKKGKSFEETEATPTAQKPTAPEPEPSPSQAPVRKAECISCHKQLERREVCPECLKKLKKACTSDASAVVFVVDASWGRYSNYIEVQNGKLFYIESVAIEIPGLPPSVAAGLWNEQIRAHKEISAEEAYSYATNEDDRTKLALVMQLIQERGDTTDNGSE